ncbi:hypothetical protein A9F13_01g01089 [Clavispora lusitaniae]|uniref:J domain-containing protein n=1 Tax=Clavispora lusitaniae TaxID=36911 RepID=A0AA91Q3L8_CLALS|nr:hypothetical protein A9F13_01g01089 [Clavispora lusitaniae]
MKLRFPLVLIALLSLVAALWSSEDYEIFSLNDKVRKDLGPDTTFYSWLGLPKGPKSTKEEIVKAYRKLSRKNHPDKLRGKSYKHKKKVEERFQRLSAVGNILKNESLKKRYDYFYRNGFPTLKGTDYLYSRFRPGIFVTLFVVFAVVSSFQYISLRISRRQDFKRISTIVDDIRLQAWGNSLVPPSDGSARKVVSPNGKEFLVSAVGDVSLVDRDEDGNEFLSPLDANAIDVNPGFKESYFYLFPCYLWNSTLGRLTGYIINTKSTYVNTKSKQTSSDSVEHGKKKKKNASQKGTKVELPNGKVIYSRKKQ